MGVVGELVLSRESGRAGGLISLNTSQVQIGGMNELAVPNIYPIHECMNGAGPTDPNLQDLHDTEQQQDIHEESQ